MGSGPKLLKIDSAPGTRSRPAPGQRGLPGTIRVWPIPVRTFCGEPCRAVEPFTPGDPSVVKVCFGLQRPESNCWTLFMGSTTLWKPVSVGDPYGP